MAFQGRHKVFVLFWTWSIGPFACMADLAQASGSKTTGGIQRCRLTLYPRAVPVVSRGQTRRTGRGYLDVLRPNDWVFVFVDPGDGRLPEPLFLGFIDELRMGYQMPANGAAIHTLNLTCSGFEKAVHNTSCISQAFISRNINIATLYDMAMRCQTEDLYLPWVSNAVQAALQVFLSAEPTEAYTQRLATSRGRSREELAYTEQQQRLADALDSAAEMSTSPAASQGNEPLSVLMGQFELPGCNLPLWRLLKLKLENVRERTATTPEGMMNQLSMPLSRFLDEWSNGLMNLLIYDVRRISADGLGHLVEGGHALDTDAVGGYTADALGAVISAAEGVSQNVSQLFNDMAPYVVLMRRPLFPNELLRLEGPELSTADTISCNLGFSDSDYYNLSWVEPVSLDQAQYRMTTGLSGFDADRERSIEGIRRHGLRIYSDQTNAWPDHGAPGEAPRIPTNDPELFREWNERIQRSGLDQIELLDGSVVVPKFVRGLYFGGKLVLDIRPQPGLFAGGSQRVFFVDGYDWNYDATTGSFRTDVALTRGYDVANELRRR